MGRGPEPGLGANVDSRWPPTDPETAPLFSGELLDPDVKGGGGTARPFMLFLDGNGGGP